MLHREQQIASNLIRSALAQGWTVSVYDAIHTRAGEWTVERSTNFEQIFDSLDTTEGDTLRFRNSEGKPRGWAVLIWGNDDDLIHDHSDSLTIDDEGRIVSEAVAA